MNLLDRLLLREIAWPLAVGLLAVLQLLVIFQLLQLNEIVFGSAVTLLDIARITAALAPHFLVVAVPLAFMLGLQLGLGRLAADQEILALQAAGIHPLRLYPVPLGLALVLAVLVAGLARYAEPWGLQQLNTVLNDAIKRNLQSGITPGQFNDALPRFMVYAEGIDGPNWKGVVIEDDVGDGAPLLLVAEAGRIEDTSGQALAFRMFRGEIHRQDARGQTVARFHEGTLLVGVQGPVSRKNRFADIDEATPQSQLPSRIRELEAGGYVEESRRLRFEAVRRLAMPLACLAFALFGVPTAILGRGVRGSAYLLTLAGFVAFYALQRASVTLAIRGVPALLAGFLPDLVIAAAGVALTVRLAHRGQRS